MARRTTAKGNFKPKRVQLRCPNCGGRFSLMPAEARKIESGKRGPCCTSVCGQAWRVKKILQVRYQDGVEKALEVAGL